jgi:hypothetical protein
MPDKKETQSGLPEEKQQPIRMDAVEPLKTAPDEGSGPLTHEGIPGGKFLLSDGKTLVNCNNQLIDESGKVLDETPLPRG